MSANPARSAPPSRRFRASIPARTACPSERKSRNVTANRPPNSMGTRHSVRPHQTPKVTASAFPPRNRNQGVKAWPRGAARAGGTRAHSERPPIHRASAMGAAPLRNSSSSAGRNHLHPPARSTFIAPGFPSPKDRISTPIPHRPMTHARGRAPIPPAIRVHSPIRSPSSISSTSSNPRGCAEGGTPPDGSAAPSQDRAPASSRWLPRGWSGRRRPFPPGGVQRVPGRQ